MLLLKLLPLLVDKTFLCITNEKTLAKKWVSRIIAVFSADIYTTILPVGRYLCYRRINFLHTICRIEED